MSKKTQLGQKYPRPDKEVFVYYNILAMYIDITLRGMIAFFTLGMFSYFVLIKTFGFPIWVTLPFIFIVSILMSPLLSKIQLGNKVQEKYDDFLRDVITILKKKKWIK